ncbi:MAG: DNA translocase FtsK 4TM domain-containing protein [Patescibacteria group bacterium]
MARKKSKKNAKNFKQPREKKGLSLNLNMPSEVKDLIYGVLLFATSSLILLSFLGKGGIVGDKFMAVSVFLFGSAVYTIPISLAAAGLVFFKTEYRQFSSLILLAALLFTCGISGVLALLDKGIYDKGGWIGHFLSPPLLKLFGFWGAEVFFLTLISIGLLIFRQLLMPSIPEKKEEEKEEKSKPIFSKVFGRKSEAPKFKIEEIISFSKKKEEKKEEKEEKLDIEVKEIPESVIASEYKIPPIDLLAQEKEKPQAGDTRAHAMIIQKTLENFGIPVQMAEVNIGPTVTQYSLKPAEGIKLSKITTLSNNLSLALAAHPIRIEAPIPGRSLVGIEIPNKIRATVTLRSLVSDSKFKSAGTLTIAMGKDVAGDVIFTDLTRMPHLLVAGATGAGKTIFLNSLILSLLYKNGPDVLRLILVDPKRVEFNAYNSIPHLLSPVIYDAPKTVNCLNWLVQEMARRFEILSVDKVKNIRAYNEKMVKEGRERMPYIVFIVDELADLIMARGRDLEVGIVRLAQLARAIGIHLVLATQRPSVEVLTGLIKANITTRVSFRVASQIDSRTVLDTSGAEKLLGSGDLLYISSENLKPKRVQGAYISDKELKRIIQWIIDNNGEVNLEDELAQDLQAELERTTIDAPGVDGGNYNAYGEPGESDILYPEAKEIVIETEKASASYLQRKLRIGYARAARLLDMLEAKGVIGPGEGAKPRQVLMGRAEEESSFGSDYNENISGTIEGEEVEE